MDKLLITIIAIGLGAVMLLWSTDYLSSFYQGAQAKSKAQAWVTEASEITQAARQAGSLSLSGDNWQQGASTTATAAALVTAYLSDLPKHSGNYVFWPCAIVSSATSCPVYITDTTHATDATMLEATVENQAVCQQIQMLANRGSATLSSVTVTGTNPISINTTLPVNSNKQFTCVNASGTYYFLYRVFLDR